MKSFYIRYFISLTIIFYSQAISSHSASNLKFINQTIKFMEHKTLVGENSFFNELQTIKKEENVIAGFLVKSFTNQLVYSLTSTTTQTGLNAIGTPLNQTNPAYAAILASHPYVGFSCSTRVTLFGEKYFAHYKPFIKQFPTDANPRLYGTVFAASKCSLIQSKKAINQAIDRVNQFIISFTLELYKHLADQNIVSTVFVRTGNEFLYALNTVPSSPSTVVVGTILDHSNPAYALALNGQNFIGEVRLFGRKYFAKYKPYKIDGRVAGIFFAGVPL